MVRNESDWLQHKLLVMDRIEKLEAKQENLGKEIHTTNQNITSLNNDAVMFESTITILPVIVLAVLAYLKFHNRLKTEQN